MIKKCAQKPSLPYWCY